MWLCRIQFDSNFLLDITQFGVDLISFQDYRSVLVDRGEFRSKTTIFRIEGEALSEFMTKPVHDITMEYIQSIVDAGTEESQLLEFKGSGTESDEVNHWPWRADLSAVQTKARNSILDEVVAFANADGGVLLLGVNGSKQPPWIAEAISPIPKCADLADRLINIFSECVEPILPYLEVQGVANSSGTGVVFIRVNKSPGSPHRVIPTNRCTIRRGDKCRTMSMHEIHALV